MHQTKKGNCRLGDSGYTGADARAEPRNCKATFFIAKKRAKITSINNTCDRREHER